MSNSSDILNDSCNHIYFYKIGKDMGYFVLYVLTPTYFVLGLSGNIILLLIMFARSKSDGVYMFQVIIALTEGPYIVLRTVDVVIEYKLTTWKPDDMLPTWWYTCYGCVWYTAHITLFLPNILATFMQFVVVCMLADRFRAFYKPLTYKPPKKNQYIVICVACFLLSLLLSSFELYGYTIEFDSSQSVYWIDWEYNKVPMAVYTMYARSAVVILGLLAMYGFNVAIPFMYYKHLKASARVSSSEQEKAKRQQMRTLMGVAVCQSITASICQTVFIVMTVHAAMPYDCKWSRYLLVFSVDELGNEIGSAANFYVLMAFSREFRRDVKNLFKRSTSSTRIEPVKSSRTQMC